MSIDWDASMSAIRRQGLNRAQMKGKFVIIDLRNMDFMKNEEGEIIYYDTDDEACTVCGMYEFENAWVMKLIYNHIEKEATHE